MTKNAWLTSEDISSDAKDLSGRPISPAPLIDGDIGQANSIQVEFPDGGTGVRMDRRHFMRLSGAATAAAGLTATTGCQVPAEKIVPYVSRNGEVQPGQPNFYATTLYGKPAQIKTRAGKPIHVEGPANHPSGVCGVSARQGAAILDLYDPDRARAPLRRDAPGQAGGIASWDRLLGELQQLELANKCGRTPQMKILSAVGLIAKWKPGAERCSCEAEWSYTPPTLRNPSSVMNYPGEYGKPAQIDPGDRTIKLRRQLQEFADITFSTSDLRIKAAHQLDVPHVVQFMIDANLHVEVTAVGLLAATSRAMKGREISSKRASGASSNRSASAVVSALA